MNNRIKRFAAGAAALLCTIGLHAAPEAGSLAETNRKTDWTFTPDPSLPNVLILGDSISIGYTRQVRELLKGKANVYRPVNADGTRPRNCNGTVVGLKVSEPMLKAHQWDVIHFNWGLHDLKHVKRAHTNEKSNDPNDPQQSTLQEYEENLREIVGELIKTDARLVFATTTPVVPGTLNPLRTPEAPAEYNAAAVKIMEENQIRVNDLHAYCLPHLTEWLQPKNVHFNPMGSQALAERVAAVISDELIRKQGSDSIAGDQPVIRLWPLEQIGGEQNRLRYEVTSRGKIRYENVKDPHLVVFPAQAEGPTPAVLYCPGGGYHHLTPRSEIIQWLNECGITVFMLRYRVPDNREAAFADAQRAMRVVRHNAGKWNVDPDQLGVMGSSAGGHLVLRLSQNYNEPAYKPFDDADLLSCEPAFVITASAAYLCKSKPDSVLAEAFYMNDKVAPTFMVCAMDDKSHGAGSVTYEKALNAAGGSAEIFVSETGGHGLKNVNWYPACREWLRKIGIDLREQKEAASALSPKNIILILADDIAYDNNFGAYGARESWTPRLDRLAREGVTFEQVYSCPKCTPSRVKIMTGRSGIRNYIGFGKLAPSEITFAHMLREAGYKTHVVGKWQLDGKGGTPTSGAGFDSWFLWNTTLATGSRYWEPNFEVNGKGTVFGKDDYGPDLCVQSVLEFIEQNREGPFFVYYPMVLVHGPFETTPDSAVRERKDPQENFKDMIRYMDKCVGKILDGLEAMGLAEDTVVLFCSDNGTNRALTYESFGSIVDGKKGVPHDRGTHSPMFVRCPGTVPAGARCADMIDFSDVLPTLADIGNAQLPEAELDGRSFWPQCRGEAGNPREWIFQYYWPKSWSWIPDELGEEELIWVHNQKYKLHGNGLFYDIVNDREELSPIPPEQFTDEQKKVYRLFKEAAASMPATNEAYVKSRSRQVE